MQDTKLDKQDLEELRELYETTQKVKEKLSDLTVKKAYIETKIREICPQLFQELEKIEIPIRELSSEMMKQTKDMPKLRSMIKEKYKIEREDFSINIDDGTVKTKDNC